MEDVATVEHEGLEVEVDAPMWASILPEQQIRTVFAKATNSLSSDWRPHVFMLEGLGIQNLVAHNRPNRSSFSIPCSLQGGAQGESVFVSVHHQCLT